MMRAAVACLLLAGCSSAAEPTPVVGNQAVFATNGASKTYGDRQAACERVVTALTTRSKALDCALTPPPACPALVDQLEIAGGLPAGSCVEYDLGTVENCEQRIATYATCDEFASKGCQLGIRRCPTSTDAGVDSAADSAPDVATDSTSDGG